MWFLIYRIIGGIVGLAGFAFHLNEGQNSLLPVLLLVFGGVASLVTDPLIAGRRPFTLRNGVALIVYVGGVSALSKYQWPFTLALLVTASAIALFDVTTLATTLRNGKQVFTGNVNASALVTSPGQTMAGGNSASAEGVWLAITLMGMVITLVFALADFTGISLLPETFGASQIIGTTVGVTAMFIGATEVIRSNRL